MLDDHSLAKMADIDHLLLFIDTLINIISTRREKEFRGV